MSQHPKDLDLLLENGPVGGVLRQVISIGCVLMLLSGLAGFHLFMMSMACSFREELEEHFQFASTSRTSAILPNGEARLPQPQPLHLSLSLLLLLLQLSRLALLHLLQDLAAVPKSLILTTFPTHRLVFHTLETLMASADKLAWSNFLQFLPHFLPLALLLHPCPHLHGVQYNSQTLLLPSLAIPPLHHPLLLSHLSGLLTLELISI